ncbi:L-lactate permease [Pseudonocardia sp. CA-142604]|uniref:L-lactate permease n=1 Tax=Pseudonocardia sp. CA-142604 TaxID=3240024 RepID=UPI003D8C1DBB
MMSEVVVYQQVIAPLGGSLGWSALAAAIPLLVLFLLLGVFRVRAWLASLIGLLVAFVIAVLVDGMPVPAAADAAAEGAAYGLYPILWIVINAIWIYHLTVESGHFDVLRRAFARISADKRVQGVIIAFSFGALLEALAGFGAPVAICAVMLVAIGMKPLKAGAVALIADTAPVAFGAVGLPITTLAQVSGLPLDDLAGMTGRQVPILAVFVPLVMLVVLDGRRGLREAWPAGLVAGVTFAVAQFLVASYGPVQLVDIVASLVSAASVLLLLQVWQPAGIPDDGPDGGRMPAGARLVPEGPGAASRPAVPGVTGGDSGGQVLLAFVPYLIVIVLFALSVVPVLKAVLSAPTVTFGWPGLDVRTPSGAPVSLTMFKFDWLIASGTVLLIAGLLTGAALRISPLRLVRAYGHTLYQLRGAGVTVMAVLGLAYVMNLSGQTATLGLFLAGAGSLYALFAPLLGWFGTAVTGSDTSSNSLFGALQASVGHSTGISPILLAAGNTSGGVLGKMISPQSLAIGAAAVGLAGREGELLRRVLVPTALFVAAMCLLVYLQSTPVLSWMVVR